MCAIFGMYNVSWKNNEERDRIICVLGEMAGKAACRGRDALGFTVFHDGSWNKHTLAFERGTKTTSVALKSLALITDCLRMMPESAEGVTIIGNARAEPTTEWVKGVLDPNNIQPYRNFPEDTFFAVHNGTIANDEKFIPQDALTRVDSQAIPYAFAAGRTAAHSMIGSVAAVVYERPTNTLILTRNYRPLAAYEVMIDEERKFVAFHSIKGYLVDMLRRWGLYSCELDLRPNTTIQCIFDEGVHKYESWVSTYDDAKTDKDSGIVVLSGGLDSTTVAELACKNMHKVTLAHFHYGCRAQTRETDAVTVIHQELQRKHPNKQISLQFFDLSFIQGLGGNALTDHTMQVAEGKDGIEYAKEWVPFRNGVMVSLIIAFCDRWGIGNIYTGVNLEEAGAFGDNEAEFYYLLEEAAAIGSKVHPKIVNPLENLMKSEIVKLAVDEGAPIQFSWSCYHGGEQHCGRCGPCLLRKTAFKMVGLTDSISYDDDQMVVGL